MPSRRPRPRWLALPAVLVVYVLAGKLGLQYAFVHASATPLWPPTGIALAALLLGGPRLWPAIFVGAFIVNVTTAGSVATSLGIAAGNTLEALVGAWLVRRFAGGTAAFTSPRTIFVFGLTAGLAASAVSATMGVGTLTIAGYAPWQDAHAIWLTWWLGDVAGALIVAPLIIVWVAEPALGVVRRRWMEAIVDVVLLVGVTTLVFGVFGAGSRNLPVAYLTLPPVVWAAYRFGLAGATAMLAALSAIAAAGTLRGHGPFAVGEANASLLLLQGFLVAVSGTVLPLAALSAELARRAAASAENARLYRESEGQRRTAVAFARTSHALVESLDVRDVANRIVASVRELLGGTIAIVFELDPASGSHIAIGASGAGGSQFTGLRIPPGVGAIGLAVRDRKLVVTTDIVADPRMTLSEELRRRIDTSELRAVVAVPLFAHGRVIGAFLVGDRAGRVFTPEEIIVAEAFADQAALAITNARLYEEAERARRTAEAASDRSTFLADASVVIGSTLDDDVILTRVAELAVPRTADWCSVFIREGSGPIRCVAFHHREPAKLERARRYLAAQPIDLDAPHGVGKVIRTGTSDFIPDVSDDTIRAVSRDEEGVRIRAEIGSRSIMAVPLRVDEGSRGAMVFGRGVPDAYDWTDLALAEDLARRVALGMQNARLYRTAREARERAEKARWQAAYLAETSRLLALSMDYDTSLDALIRHAVPTLGDWALVHLARRDGSVRRIGPAYADPALAPLAEEMPELIPASSPTADAVRGGRGVLVAEITPEWIAETVPDPRYRAFVTRLRPVSAMIVPLLARGRPVGDLMIVSLNPARRYGPSDLVFAEEIGRRAGVAVDNARLYRQAEEARADAEQANRAKDEFLAVLSHELRTPLNSVAGWMQMLETRTIDGDRAERAMAAIGRNVTVLRRLIEDLLDVSRIVAGKLTVEPAPCDVATIIEQAIEGITREAEHKDVSVKSTLERSLVVEADALRLRQVVGNLLSNALKFTPPGGAVVVSLRRAGRRAILTVADTGAGIPDSVLPHIFERFRQADSSSTRQHGGLGLGLAIVKHLVELHGGTVRAENRTDAPGALFTVDLPAVA